MSKNIVTEELKNLLDEKKDITQQTRTNYINQYNKIYEITKSPLSELDQNEIKNAIINASFNSRTPIQDRKESDLKPTNIWVYLNIAIMILKNEGKPYNHLDDWREEMKEKRSSHTQKTNDDKELPSFKELEKFTNQLYEDGKYRDYIINKLLLTLGLRNKDLNLTIVDKEPDDVSKNYLIVKNSILVELQINDFKTVKKYGEKELVIRNKKLATASKNLVGTHLLDNSSVIQKFIMRRLYKHNGKNLSEGDYFKILVKHLLKQDNSIQLLRQISDSRGTD
eukprot:gene38261-46493_t